MTSATQEKRAEFLQFMERVLLPETAVQAVVGVGSIATGQMRPDSDIDIILFLDPYDLYIVPAEAFWLATNNSFHDIFSEDETIQQGLQLDFMRYDWQQWRDLAFAWPEERLSELASGWIVYDRYGDVTKQIKQRSHFPDNVMIFICGSCEIIDLFLLVTIQASYPRRRVSIFLTRVDSCLRRNDNYVL